jgi:hypothetical protein
MLASRWNQVRDPEARESLRLIEQAINQGFAALGIDPLPSQQNQTAQGGSPITSPRAPLALSVSSVSGGVLVQIAANPANIKPVNYFVETSASASFTNVTVYRFGLLQTDTINIGAAALFFRCRCQYFNSGFSPYVLFGNPTAVTGGSSSLGSTTGKGAVVLQTSPTIVTPAISGDETVSGNLLVGGLIKNQSGTAVMGTALKSGTNSGADYTTTSVFPTFVDVDSPNLSYTVTIPAGWKLMCWAAGTFSNDTVNNQSFVQLFDTAGGVSLNRVAVGEDTTQINYPFSLVGQVVGDGNSHTIKLQFSVSPGGTAHVVNQSGFYPQMIFLLLPSN